MNIKREAYNEGKHDNLPLGQRIADCTGCGAPMFQNRFHVSAYADGDYYKCLYTVCSLECERAIEEGDDD